MSVSDPAQLTRRNADDGTVRSYPTGFRVTGHPMRGNAFRPPMMTGRFQFWHSKPRGCHFGAQLLTTTVLDVVYLSRILLFRFVLPIRSRVPLLGILLNPQRVLNLSSKRLRLRDLACHDRYVAGIHAVDQAVPAHEDLAVDRVVEFRDESPIGECGQGRCCLERVVNELTGC